MSGRGLLAGALVALWSLSLAVASVLAFTSRGYEPGVRYPVPVPINVPWCMAILELGPGYCTTYRGRPYR